MLTKACRDGRPARPAQAGMSLVELMVGVAVGLLITAGAISLFVSNVAGSRRLLIEARLNQDLRAVADLVARDLRRGGYWGNAIAGTQAVGMGAAALKNPYAGLAVNDDISYSYAERNVAEDDAVANTERFGFRLRANAVEVLVNNQWTPLTSTAAMSVTDFGITPSITKRHLGHLCPRSCPVGTPNCPEVAVRSIAVTLTGHSASDVTLERTLHSTVRIRNDEMLGACP